uniref:Uncharacterized protein n=1 Tax=Octopus bimaculoides TaxID=37653 RepID=A0A0L8GBH0_OCTBM
MDTYLSAEWVYYNMQCYRSISILHKVLTPLSNITCSSEMASVSKEDIDNSMVISYPV